MWLPGRIPVVLGFVSLSPGPSGSRSPHGAWGEVSDSEELPWDGIGFIQRGRKAAHILEPAQSMSTAGGAQR